MSKLTSLTLDEKKILEKESQTMLFTMNTLLKKIKDESLTDEIRNTMLGLIEMQYSKVCDLLDFDSETRHQLDDRFSSSKKTYQRIEELEKKLANGSIDDKIPFVLKDKEGRIRDWWNNLSFRHVEDVHFYPQYTKIELGFMISTPFLSDTPVTDKQVFEEQLESYKEKGMTITKGPIGLEMMDTKINQSILEDMVKSRFPSGTIEEIIRIPSCGNKEILQIDKLIVHVHNFSDI